MTNPTVDLSPEHASDKAERNSFLALIVGIIAVIIAVAALAVALNKNNNSTAAGGSTSTTAATSGTTAGGSVAIPDVVGMKSAKASHALQAAGFVVQVNRQTSSSVPAKTVYLENPAAGTHAAHGSTVTLSVSKGP